MPPTTRARGAGAVREVRPGIWRAWRARTRRPDGSTARPSETFSGPDAEERAKRWAGGEPEPALLYLGQHCERWLSLTRPSLAPSTYALRRRYVAACGPLLLRPLAELAVDDWQEQCNRLLAVWSRETVKVWRMTMTTALRAAIPRHLPDNPLERVRLPRPVESTPRAWTQAELDRLLAAAEGSHHEPWLLFSLGTGVRLGESRALLWSDVDLAQRAATIRASLDNRTHQRGPTKSRRVRVVEIPDDVAAVLADHRKRQPPGEPLVFGRRGHPYEPSTFRRFLATTCRRAGVPVLSPHSTRHTCASLALDRGVPVQDVARQLGHSVQMCQRTYAHYIGGGLRRMAGALGGALAGRFSGVGVPTLARRAAADQE